ncbi:MAG: response regulator [Vicinamibacterales bacterium]
MVTTLGLRSRLVLFVVLVLIPALGLFAWFRGETSQTQAVEIAQRDNRALDTSNVEIITTLFALVAAGVIASAVSLMIAERQIRRPLVRLLQAARQMEKGDLAARASLTHGVQEVKRLGAAFDRMAATLQERERSAREAQRLDAIGQLAGGLAHDLNNMLTVILGFSHGLESDVRSASGRENLAEIVGAAERASNLTSQLLAFARRQVQQVRPIQLNDTLTQVGTMLRQVIGVDIAMVQRLSPDLGVIRADPSQIEQIILNLVLNARDAMPHGGTLRLETRNLTVRRGAPAALSPVGYAAVPPDDYVMLTVGDSGHGMPPEVRARLGEPFFTTKGARGTGLGLATVYGITSQSAGFLACESVVGKGTDVSILLPRIHDAVVEPAASRPLERAPRAKAHAGSETLLLVEDERSVRMLTERVLRGAGYAVVAADCGANAVEIVRQGMRPDLVLTDVIMPHMNGVTLAEHLRAMVPGINVAYMSGHVEHAILRTAQIAPGSFLKKPFTPDTLLRSVRAVLDTANAADVPAGGPPPTVGTV